MRCSSIKKNKCWNRIESELTNNSIRLLIDLLHTDVVHLSLLKRVGLVGSFNFLFWAFICIMPHLPALEAFILTYVFLAGWLPLPLPLPLWWLLYPPLWFLYL